MFELLLPWVFVLLPLPWWVRRLLPARQEVQQSGLFIPFANDLRVAGAERQPLQLSYQGLLLLAWLAWVLLLLAAAKPQWLSDPVEVARSGRDVMLAVDLSGSMQTKDFVLHGQKLDRLTATKVVATAFIQRREGDRIGLILFGSQAYLQAPLTFDRTTVNTFLQEAAIGLAGKETAIGDAIGLAVKRLKDRRGVADLVLVLLTDGVNTAGSLKPEEGLALAQDIGLRIHTIGIGASSMQVASFFGSRTVNPSADLDEKMLRNIAEQTGGRYFRAHNVAELEQIYALIDQLEPVEQDTQTLRLVRALFIYPLSFALFLAVLVVLLRKRLLWV